MAPYTVLWNNGSYILRTGLYIQHKASLDVAIDQEMTKPSQNLIDLKVLTHFLYRQPCQTFQLRCKACSSRL